MPYNRTSWPERFQLFFRLILPYGTLGLFFALDVISFQIPPFGTLRPCLTLMAVFYWSVYRPTLMPNWFVFLLGLAMDNASGMPLGLNAMIYLIVQYIISDQRRFFVGQPFISLMLGFATVLIASSIVRWLIFSLLSSYWPPVMPIVGSVTLGLFLFPLINILLHMIHKLLPHQKAGVFAPGRSKK